MTQGKNCVSSDRQVPPSSLVFPHVIPFRMPGFSKQDLGNTFAQSPEDLDCGKWFDEFADRAIAAIGNRFLPVCRMSDGEFGFLFGPRYRWPRPQQGLGSYLSHALDYAKECAAVSLRGARALTMSGIPSGQYSLAERRLYRRRAAEGYATVARFGVVAIHLEFSDHPFNEQYYAPLRRWLPSLGVSLSLSNYVPFSFVYGLLRGPRRRELFQNRDIVAIHCATGSKRAAITRTLLEEGAASVHWIEISQSRSFLDTLPTTMLRGGSRLVLVGAGLGKPSIFSQLQATETLCLDAGYCFEVWADPDRQWYRAYLTPDDSFDWRKARFIDERRRVRHELPAAMDI